MTLFLQPLKAQADVTYDYKSNVMWINGKTTQDSKREIQRIMKEASPKYIMMEGPGGNFYAGLEIGDMLEGYHVVITGRCVSACAASALGAKEISFLNDTALLFHGPYISRVPIKMTLEEYSIFIVRAWLDFGIYLEDKGVSQQFLKNISLNSNTCKLVVVKTQEELKMIKTKQYPALETVDYCRNIDYS